MRWSTLAVIAPLLAAVAGCHKNDPAAMRRDARAATVREDIARIAKEFAKYRKLAGSMPASYLEVMEYRAKNSLYGSCGEEIPTDPWGAEYHFAFEGEILMIGTLGADRKPGGTGEDADILQAFDLPD
jgi:hypothetical protein